MRALLLLMVPALVFWAMDQLLRNDGPRWARRVIRWIGRIGNITLAVYCGLVALYALVAAIRFSDARGDVEVALGLAVSVVMALLSVQFWRAARRLGA
ncbi:MAG: OpgC domain-containing protein [Dehalococcoidia bacterium]|nr:OpgC domain-containing protein [Dehalococcoidia bacterium]